MIRSLALALAFALLLFALTVGSSNSRADEPSTTQASYSLWNGKETIAQYVKKNKIKKVEQALDLGKGVKLKVTLIPAGKFQMGCGEDEAKICKSLMHNGAGDPADELPQHEVTISKPFYMGEAVVTQEQCQALTTKNGDRDKGAHLPETVLSYEDALDFCKAMSTKTGMTVRLPTEAEWEYACRAGTTTPFYTGPTITTADANYLGEGVWPPGKPGNSANKMLPCGSFRPNQFGLYDMHGNVSVWCSDWYAPDYYAKSPAVDPTGPENGQKRVVRGGAALTPPRNIRSDNRDAVPPGTIGISMRVVVELP